MRVQKEKQLYKGYLAAKNSVSPRNRYKYLFERSLSPMQTSYGEYNPGAFHIFGLDQVFHGLMGQKMSREIKLNEKLKKLKT